MIIEPTLGDALACFAPPVAFLDFETVGLAIPVWNGCHPYDQVPVQFSAYVPDEHGVLHAHDWLAEGPGDPRPVLAERLLAACEGPYAIVAVQRRLRVRPIRELAVALPYLAVRLEALARAWWTCCPRCAITFIIRTSAAASRSSACCPRWCPR
jgi:hypothetical protein